MESDMSESTQTFSQPDKGSVPVMSRSRYLRA